MRRVSVLIGLVLVVASAALFWMRRASTAPSRAARVAEAPAPAAELAGPALDEPVTLDAPDAPHAPSRVEARAAIPVPEPPIGRRVTTLIGRFVDDRGGPLAGVEARIRHADPEAHSGADGRFRLALEREEKPRSVVVIARDGRHVSESREVAIEPGVETDLGDWTLELGGSLAGRVVDLDGRAVAGARVLTTRAETIDREWARRSDVWTREVEGESDAHGEFRLDAVPQGRLRAWAIKTGYLNAIGDPLELAAGEVRGDVELVLELESEADAIDILVLRPDGAPCANAEVAYEYATASRSGSGSASCDDDGRLHYRFPVLCRHSFRASDPEGELGVALAEDVMPGHGPLTLQLSEPRTLELEVVDAAGEPVRDFSAQIVRADREQEDELGPSVGPDEEPPGRATLGVPPLRFALDVRAPGFADRRLGPFEPAAAPPAVRAELEPVPGIAGRVLIDGEPVAGARVRAGTEVERNHARVVNGFPADRDFARQDQTVTGADGRFALYPRSGGTLWLRAEHAGRAPAFYGPFEHDPAIGRAGVDLELPLGGAIEGRVLLPAGESPAGAILGASCGDGLAQTTRADSEGRFRFERLAPGRWLVKRVDAEISRNSTTSSTFGVERAVELPSNCTVREGEVTRLDLDLRFDPRPRVLGRLRLGGAPAVGWRVGASTDGDVFGSEGAAETGADGRFELRAPSAGPGRLTLRPQDLEGGWQMLFAKTEWTEGDNPWERDLPAGGLEVSRAASGGLDVSYRLQWSAAGDALWFSSSFDVPPGGSRTFERLPAGSWKLSRRLDGAWAEAGSIEVRANELARATLP